MYVNKSYLKQDRLLFESTIVLMNYLT